MSVKEENERHSQGGGEKRGARVSMGVRFNGRSVQGGRRGCNGPLFVLDINVRRGRSIIYIGRNRTVCILYL